ncbi:MAG: hypothetical protein ACON4E_02190 [Flavobacteriales bacterium]
MRSVFPLLIVLVLAFSSCITIETSSSGFKDEIYYSASTYTEKAIEEESVIQNEENYNTTDESTEVDEYSDEYSSDDYYDYQYSTRLRRFHGPSFGFGYYNNYFTNSFWYSNNPYHCGVSIYYGYNFWNPHYYDPFYAYSYHPFYYNSFYHYPTHYHNHYHDHLLSSYYPTYYNSYDNNSIYYGPRDNNTNKTPERFATLYSSQIKNRPPQSTYSNSSLDDNKKPLYTTKPSLNNFSDRPASKINNSFDTNNSDTKPNNFNNRPAYNSVNSQVQQNSKPDFSLPTNQKPSNNYQKPSRYSKPSKTKKPFENKINTSPSRNNNSYSTPSFNSSPKSFQRSSSPRGGRSPR